MNKDLETVEFPFYVYRHLRNTTGQPFYVGIGKKKKYFAAITTEYERAYDTKVRSEYWIRIFEKHGRTVEILFEGLTHEEAKKKEIEFIAIHGRDDRGGILCNRTNGGDGMDGYTHSDETKAKMKESASKRVYPKFFTEEHKRNISEARKGFKWSPESRAKLSASKKGKKLTIKNKRTDQFKPVICIDTGHVFDSVNSCAREMFGQKRVYNRLIDCLKGRSNTYKGYRFNYVDKDHNPIPTPYIGGVKQKKLTIDEVIEIKKLLSEGMSRNEIAKKFGVVYHTIYSISKGTNWGHV